MEQGRVLTAIYTPPVVGLPYIAVFFTPGGDPDCAFFQSEAEALEAIQRFQAAANAHLRGP